MNTFLKATQFVNGCLLVRFSLSKLMAWPISVKAFIEMAKPIGIDPTFFRIFKSRNCTVSYNTWSTNFFNSFDLYQASVVGIVYCRIILL